MGNEEYKEIMCELYKFLRDKISLNLGEYLNDDQKEKLFSFEVEENIVIDNEFNKIIKYSFDDDKIHISDEFLTPEYIDKIKSKNPDFNIDDLKNKVNAEDPKVLLEELIVFSGELKIQEKDIIKSLFIQEILKMLIMGREMDPKEEVIICGTIELLAHNLGNQNGFLVSTPKKLLSELEVAISLKRELEDKFEEIILKGNVLDYLSRIQNSRLLEKINDLADDRKIIESTQNLDNVIDSIVNMTNENQEIINEVNKKEEVKKMEEGRQEPVVEENKEEIVEIGDTEEVKTEPIVTEVSEVPTNDVVESAPIVEERVQEEVATVNDETVIPPVPEPVVNEVTSEPAKTNKKALIYTVAVILTIALGVLIGYLLFKFK